MAAATPGGPDANLCPRCGTPFVRGQEYCLECGLRLAAGSGLVGFLAAAWRDRFGRYPGDWIWPVLFGLLIAIASGTVAIVLADTGRGGDNTLIATLPGQPREPVSPSPTQTVALPTVPRGTPTTGGPPPTQTTPPPARTTARPPGSLTPWPVNRNGWTVVLESIPGRAGRGFAVERARAASRSGMPQVGVLDSSRYASLHPGYFVVFSGIYGSKGEADRAAGRAGRRGFASAYSRQITS